MNVDKIEPGRDRASGGGGFMPVAVVDGCPARAEFCQAVGTEQVPKGASLRCRPTEIGRSVKGRLRLTVSPRWVDEARCFAFLAGFVAVLVLAALIGQWRAS